MKQSKSSKIVAFGGIISALSLIFMFLTGIFPAADYALPAISGMVLVALVIDIDKKTAYLSYIVVGILSLLIAPVKESAVLFILLFGYYPILKGSIEQIKSRIAEWGCKLAIFNMAIFLAYLSIKYILGITEAMSDSNFLVKYGIPLFILLANATFILYDIALTGLIAKYCEVVRPKLNRIFKK